MTDPTVTPPSKRPDWAFLIPDTRTFVMTGIFALAWRVLEMVSGQPALLKDSAFMTLATLIVGGSGMGAAVQFFFGSSKSSSTKDETIATMAAQTPPAPSMSVQTTQPLSPTPVVPQSPPPGTPP